jgi:ribosomal protein S18 acetylase RimI-like enzyme
MRLEVHQGNHAAIACYRKSGYREFARHRYYEDGGDALRFEKRLVPAIRAQVGAALFSPDQRITCGPAWS